jgi:WD40 repeat protein
VLNGHTHNVLALAVRDDGYAVASAGAIANADDTHGVILWDLQQPHPLGRPLRPASPGYVAQTGTALSADGTSWAYALGDTVWWDGRELVPPKRVARGPLSAVALSPDGSELALSTREGPIARAFRSPTHVRWQSLKTPVSNVLALWYAASDLMARGNDGTIARFLPSGVAETVQNDSRDEVRCADLSTTGPSIASEGDNNGTTREIRIRYFDSRSQRVVLLPIASGSCSTIAFAHDSGIAVRSSHLGTTPFALLQVSELS